MPYRLRGKTVEVQKGGRWVKVKTHKDRASALAHYRALLINVEKKHK